MVIATTILVRIQRRFETTHRTRAIVPARNMTFNKDNMLIQRVYITIFTVLVVLNLLTIIASLMLQISPILPSYSLSINVDSMMVWY